MTLFLGIDLGLSGALAFVDESGAVERVASMPTLSSTKSRSVYDLPQFRAILLNSRPAFAVAEQLHAMPMAKGGSQANFSRGLALGIAQTLLFALEIPHQLVPPQRWQKAMHGGIAGDDTKQKSIVACHRLFPSTSLRRSERCRVDDDGIADALLLAEYARRTWLNEATRPAA